ncbi:DUF3616 domain-containing protein [Rhodoplanes sp. TEM]|uniref:DUF3616 domain-containing protein n=1 Tax=Rhodoplanes tepidamans TaxID=200616 RepID=A0ABT5JCJ0_RHOTP|nr:MULTISPECIES: DUF3616 domain-containing protein [Rhodoplanes]MDC7787086.1 DUF3616 domain-containing protein [Rhodoplanes tepidamans]MDC7986321.1 DUF3616 domain-containing protein [Rhodoplanes sp. TEM]MDQ0358686.1 hypothetical protein [Rhodoplanes tepidamans]
MPLVSPPPGRGPVRPLRLLVAVAVPLWLAAAAAAVAAPAAAEMPALAPAKKTWSVDGDFARKAAGETARTRARMNLSGAACAPARPRLASCLIVNDEKKYAQFFAVKDRTLEPGTVIRLTAKDVRGDPDAEGVAFADGFFWVVGSHGRPRHGDGAGSARFVVMRFPVDARGRPTFPVSEEEPTGVERSTRLGEAMRAADGIGAFYDQPLDRNGVNVEGIAVKDGRMHLGFRGPSVDGQAFILSVDAEAVFSSDKPLAPTVTRLALGPTTGIRDLAAVRDGLIVLSGPVNDQAVPPALWHWNETTGALAPLGTLTPPKGLPEDAKAETVLVLRDAPDKPLHLLILYDGAENGFPTEYRVRR